MRWIYDEERTENTNEGLRIDKMDSTLYESTVFSLTKHSK
jgi:hypothetical protein